MLRDSAKLLQAGQVLGGRIALVDIEAVARVEGVQLGAEPVGINAIHRAGGGGGQLLQGAIQQGRQGALAFVQITVA